MCGLCGFLATTSAQAATRDDLEAMRDAMRHRGPDDEGLWLSPCGLCGLGHRRLSIIDLSDTARQPMTGEDGRIHVVFNGEIYNHAALRQELSALGHTFATDHSDTEVLVHGFEQWDQGLWDRLIGMFAVAVHDAHDGSLTLVRDRVGIKPLYFSLLPGAVAFASEIKGLLCFPGVPREMSFQAAYHYLTFMTPPAPLTMFQGIYKLPAGTRLRITRDSNLDFARWWDALPDRNTPESELRGLSDSALQDHYVRGVRQRLEKAVERRMISDAPMGAFLSGGIDSTTNVALMSQHMDRPLDTFTVGFSDHTHLNEFEHSRKVAKLYGTASHEVLISETDMEGYLEQLIHTQDEPLADWVCIPLYFVSKLAAQSGIKAIQVGEGADEQFCGYPGYMDYLRLYNRYWRPFRKYLPGPAKRLAASCARGLATLAPNRASLADIIDRATHDRRHFWSGATVFWELQKRALLSASLPTAGDDHGLEALTRCGMLPPGYLEADSFNIVHSFDALLDASAQDTDILNRMTYYEFKLRLPELLLMRVDKITMSVSLEARVPFLDHELVEFTMGIPMQWKIRGGRLKHILKEAVADIVPQDIINRPKMGFGAPMREWLLGKFGARCEAEILGSGLLARGFIKPAAIRRLFAEHRRGVRDQSVYIWSIYNLTSWYDAWIDGKKP